MKYFSSNQSYEKITTTLFLPLGSFNYELKMVERWCSYFAIFCLLFFSRLHSKGMIHSHLQPKFPYAPCFSTLTSVRIQSSVQNDISCLSISQAKKRFSTCINKPTKVTIFLIFCILRRNRN